jgi:hypothetical protein
MDYLIEVGDDQYYGPTTVGALQEFLKAGEITLETSVTNCKDATRMKVKNLVELPEPELENTAEPTRAGNSIRINLQQRIRELEERIEQERRAREAAEHLVHKLEARIGELGG